MKALVSDAQSAVWNCLRLFPMWDEEKMFERYFNNRVQRHFNSWMVNGITIEGSIYLITKIMERKSAEEMFFFFAAHLFTNRQHFTKIGNNFDVGDVYLLRNCKIEDIYYNYKYCKNKNAIAYV